MSWRRRNVGQATVAYVRSVNHATIYTSLVIKCNPFITVYSRFLFRPHYVGKVLRSACMCCLFVIHTCRHARCGYIGYCLFVCLCVCLFVRLRISPPGIKLAASNFARRFIGVQGRESPIFVNFAPPEAQTRTNRRTIGRLVLGWVTVFGRAYHLCM